MDSLGKESGILSDGGDHSDEDKVKKHRRIPKVGKINESFIKKILGKMHLSNDDHG